MLGVRGAESGAADVSPGTGQEGAGRVGTRGRPRRVTRSAELGGTVQGALGALLWGAGASVWGAGARSAGVRGAGPVATGRALGARRLRNSLALARGHGGPGNGIKHGETDGRVTAGIRGALSAPAKALFCHAGEVAAEGTRLPLRRPRAGRPVVCAPATRSAPGSPPPHRRAARPVGAGEVPGGSRAAWDPHPCESPWARSGGLRDSPAPASGRSQGSGTPGGNPQAAALESGARSPRPRSTPHLPSRGPCDSHGSRPTFPTGAPPRAAGPQNHLERAPGAGRRWRRARPGRGQIQAPSPGHGAAPTFTGRAEPPPPACNLVAI